MSKIIENYLGVKSALKMSNKAVELLVVSKGVKQEFITPLLDIKVADFAESRLQEALQKWADIPEGVNLHMIGPVQSNKLKKITEYFDVIHSISSFKLLEGLLKICISSKGKDFPRFYLQINIGIENQKGGFLPWEVNQALDIIRGSVLEEYFEGFMCIPPAHKNPSLYFCLMKHLKYKYKIKKLSMGMSSDFHKALMYDSSIIRVGSAVFK